MGIGLIHNIIGVDYRGLLESEGNYTSHYRGTLLGVTREWRWGMVINTHTIIGVGYRGLLESGVGG